jgi:hypothetical protein
MKFPEDNKIRFGQDFSFWEGIPSDVEFKVEQKIDKKYVLCAYGYGLQIKGDSKAYGCGRLYVWGLTPEQKELFEKELGKTPENFIPKPLLTLKEASENLRDFLVAHNFPGDGGGIPNEIWETFCKALKKEYSIENLKQLLQEIKDRVDIDGGFNTGDYSTYKKLEEALK